jgi:hypothetical protein
MQCNAALVFWCELKIALACCAIYRMVWKSTCEVLLCCLLLSFTCLTQLTVHVIADMLSMLVEGTLFGRWDVAAEMGWSFHSMLHRKSSMSSWLCRAGATGIQSGDVLVGDTPMLAKTSDLQNDVLVLLLNTAMRP